MKGSRFDLGFCILGEPDERLFLSVTESFVHGPGIHRDGLREPWMLDPHHLRDDGRTTKHAYLQRAGTWTIYHHLKRFHEKMGKDWTILGAQSNGDLTMNPWHVAFLGKSALNDYQPGVCGLFLENATAEPVTSRWYRALIKWTHEAAKRRGRVHEFLDVRPMPPDSHGRPATLHVHPSEVQVCAQSFFRMPGYEGGDEIGSLVEFALSGKPIIERKHELALPAVTDRFQDVRHVFHIPSVPADVGNINLGEYQLFNNLNERRAALYAPVLIDLEKPDVFVVPFNELKTLLVSERYELTDHCPTRRGQFRWYPDDVQRPRIEIFFQPGVYPFGTLGMREGQRPEVVSLSCGGLSGRLGNTLEGVSRMMFDYFRCDDAIILDEGFDVCLIVNERYSNEELLRKVWSFTRNQFAKDHEASQVRPDPGYEGGAREYPLNAELVSELDGDYDPADHHYGDIFRVLPGRSQIRSMLILARKSSRPRG